MDDVTLSGLTGLGAVSAGQFVCVSGTLSPLLSIRVLGVPRVLNIALTGTGFGPVPLGSTSAQVRRALRALVGQAVTACGTVRIGRGAGGVPVAFLDVSFLLPTAIPTPFADRSLLRSLLFQLMLSGTLGTAGLGISPLGLLSGLGLGSTVGLENLLPLTGLLSADDFIST